MIATPSPSATPASSSARPSAFDRASVCAKVRVPSSSSIAVSSGCLTAFTIAASAGEVPHRLVSLAMRRTLSGLVGRSTPTSASTPAVQIGSVRRLGSRSAIEPTGSREVIASSAIGSGC